MKFTLLAFAIAVAANQVWITAANPPPQVGEPNVCVYPSRHEYRCNQNEKLPQARIDAIRADVLSVMADTVKKVYEGDVEGFKDIYMPDCMFVFDDNVMMGWEEIKPFIQGSVGGGGKVAVFSNFELLVPSERRALVVGGDFILDGQPGKFVFEDWYKQDDGTWKILYEKLQSTP